MQIMSMVEAVAILTQVGGRVEGQAEVEEQAVVQAKAPEAPLHLLLHLHLKWNQVLTRGYHLNPKN